jgi:conjugal transfer pilus assembly protein TraL
MASTDSDYVKVPRGIDDPPRLLLWRVDEMLPLMVALCVGFMIGQLLFCLILGIIAVRYYKKFNNNTADGLPLHFCYWIGYVKGKGYSFKNPFIRRFFP